MNAQATSDNAALSDVPNGAAAALLRVGRGIKSSVDSGCERRERRPPRFFAGAAVRARRQQASCFEAQTCILAAPAGAEDPQGLKPEEADSKNFNGLSFFRTDGISRVLPSSR